MIHALARFGVLWDALGRWARTAATQQAGPAGDKPAGPARSIEAIGSACARGTGRNRLTRYRSAGGCRTGWRILHPRHVNDGSGRIQRSTGSRRPTERNQRRTGRHYRHRRYYRHRRRKGQRRHDRHRSTDRHRARHSHWHAGHIGHGCRAYAPGGRRTRSHGASGRDRTTSGRRHVARLPLDARVTTRNQRGGRRVGAQRDSNSAQPNAGNNFDVEPIDDRHQRQLSFIHAQ